MINDFMIHVLNRIDLSANFFGTLPLKLKNMPSHKLNDTVNCLATVQILYSVYKYILITDSNQILYRLWETITSITSFSKVSIFKKLIYFLDYISHPHSFNAMKAYCQSREVLGKACRMGASVVNLISER